MAEIKGMARIALKELQREIERGVQADRDAIARGGQHHNGPRGVTVEIGISRAAAAASALAELLATTEPTDG